VIALRVAAALLLLLAIVPELSRYAAERRLYRATAVTKTVAARPSEVPDPLRALAWAEAMASGTASDLPGDGRPFNIAGSAQLFSGAAGRALDTFRRGLALGERPELDLNVGRAYASLGRREPALAATLRGVWVSPGLLPLLPRGTQEVLRPALTALEEQLVSGALAAPPPLPQETATDR
jgi:hypothetical protein